MCVCVCLCDLCFLNTTTTICMVTTYLSSPSRIPTDPSTVTRRCTGDESESRTKAQQFQQRNKHTRKLSIPLTSLGLGPEKLSRMVVSQVPVPYSLFVPQFSVLVLQLAWVGGSGKTRLRDATTTPLHMNHEPWARTCVWLCVVQGGQVAPLKNSSPRLQSVSRHAKYCRPTNHFWTCKSRSHACA